MNEGGQGWAAWSARSQSITAIAGALAKAQAEIKAAERSSENPFFHSSYADMEAVVDACRAALTKYEIAVVQPLESDERGLWVVTLLLHSSGEWISGRVLVPPPPLVKKRREDGSEEDANAQQLGPEEQAAQARRPQVMGAAITYYRRFALASIVGVVAEGEDDDGEATEGRGTGGGQKRQPTPPCPQCGSTTAVIRGKKEFGGGWVCWKNARRGPAGCGHTWTDAPSDEADFQGEADRLRAETARGRVKAATEKAVAGGTLPHCPACQSQDVVKNSVGEWFCRSCKQPWKVAAV